MSSGWTVWQAIEDSYIDHMSLGVSSGYEYCSCGYLIEWECGLGLHQAWACATRTGLDPDAEIEPWPDGKNEFEFDKGPPTV